MIRSLPSHAAHAVNTRTAQTGARTTRAATSFQTLMQTQPASTSPSATTARLGPFTGDPSMHPAVEPAKTPGPVTSSPYLPAGYPGDRDLMNKTEHEQTMNDWLQNYTKWSNDNKTQIYQQALSNWQINDQRCQELGIASPPKPAPPALEPIQGMPSGWWFKS
jgi:hypothetical protein